MITQLYIDNFKTLIDFRMPCHVLTCLIGLNNSGKTTIIQAFDFLSFIASGKVLHFLELRDWTIDSIRSHQKKDKHVITFKLQFHLNDNTYTWSGTFHLNALCCITERITRNNEEEILLNVDHDSYQLLNGSLKSIDFAYEGSILAFLKEKLLPDELINIKQFLSSIICLDLLNPHLIRKPVKPLEHANMRGGEKLAAFLCQLSKEQKEKLCEQLRHIFKKFNNYEILSNDTGWQELFISEKKHIHDSVIGARHISDGFLRLMAIFSQLQTDYSVLLLDEIENGLNHEFLEYVIDALLTSKKQIIFTTHSPMILNYLEDDVALQSVIYIKNDDQTGVTSASKFFTIPNIKSMLDYMGPGEVYANVDLEALQ